MAQIMYLMLMCKNGKSLVRSKQIKAHIIAKLVDMENILLLPIKAQLKQAYGTFQKVKRLLNLITPVR